MALKEVNETCWGRSYHLECHLFLDQKEWRNCGPFNFNANTWITQDNITWHRLKGDKNLASVILIEPPPWFIGQHMNIPDHTKTKTLEQWELTVEEIIKTFREKHKYKLHFSICTWGGEANRRTEMRCRVVISSERRVSPAVNMELVKPTPCRVIFRMQIWIAVPPKMFSHSMHPPPHLPPEVRIRKCFY